MEFRLPPAPGAAGAVNHVGHLGQGGSEALGIGNSSQADLDLGKVRGDELYVAGLPQQKHRRDPASSQTIQNMASDKATGACEQDLQSEQAQFLAYFPKLIQCEIDLRIGVGCHQADAN